MRRQDPPVNPGTAAVLSFLVSGLGQIYNGQIGLGLLLNALWLGAVFCASRFAIVLSGKLMGLDAALPDQAMVLGLLAVAAGLAVWYWGIHQAFHEAQRQNDQRRRAEPRVAAQNPAARPLSPSTEAEEEEALRYLGEASAPTKPPQRRPKNRSQL